jgi:hypothetical protein
VNPDIRVNKFAITGGTNQVGLVTPALDYWILIRNIWILGSNPESAGLNRDISQESMSYPCVLESYCWLRIALIS